MIFEGKKEKMLKKRVFYTEIAYICGLILLAVGTSLMERAELGLSMVVAPAYVLHLKIAPYLPFFSFGMASYLLQALLLGAMMLILRRAKLSFLFSFITAVLYGFILDGTIALFAFLPEADAWYAKALFYAVGLVISAMGLSFLFRTYISPEAYDLFVRETSSAFHVRLHRFKTCYDCVSCLVAIALSLLFFGFPPLRGVGIGTVICAFLNGTLIRLWSVSFEKLFTYEDALPKLKRFF